MAANDWSGFLSQFYTPGPRNSVWGQQPRNLFGGGQPSQHNSQASYTDPYGFGNDGSHGQRRLTNTDNLRDTGWAKLWDSGLMSQFLPPSAGGQNDVYDSYSRQDSTDALQAAFHRWQLEQMQGQVQQQPTEVQAVQPTASSANVLQAFAQSAPITSPAPNQMASLLAAMNGPGPQQLSQQVNPLTSWIMQYLGG